MSDDAYGLLAGNENFVQGDIMLNVLHNWIQIGSNAYDEYTFVPWLNKNVYRRTVDLSGICIQ